MVTDASLQSLLWEPNAENVTKNFQLISIKIHKSLLTLQKNQLCLKFVKCIYCLKISTHHLSVVSQRKFDLNKYHLFIARKR